MSLTEPPFYSRQKEEEEKVNILNGYPITKEPFHDPVLKYQQTFKIMPDKLGFHTFALTYARDALGLVQKESLEMFRQLLLIWFANDPELLKRVEDGLPSNVIAISVAQPSFVVGRWCQGFELQNRYKSISEQNAYVDQEFSDRIQNRFKPTTDQNGFWTYQKLSESIQCTYYNENGVQFLAGICLYPAPYNRPMFLQTNPCLTGLATSGAISYPLSDREESYNFVNLHRYGRYCDTAGKYVAVEVGKNDGIPRHMEFDYNAQRNNRVMCDECAEEYHTYTWEEPREVTPTPNSSANHTSKGYPFAREPFIPDILKYQHNFILMSGTNSKGKLGGPAIGVSFAPADTYIVANDRLATIQQLLWLWHKNDPALKAEIDLLKNNVIAISVPQRGFVVGKSCLEFKLQYESRADGHFTYRKLSESVHCTYYNSNGIQTLAGICLFPALHGNPMVLEADKNAPTPTESSTSTVPPPFSADQTPLFSRANSMESLLNGFEMIGGISNNITRANSIESLLNGFEKIGGISDNESEIDFEVI